MSIAEKLQTIAENEQKVFDAGTEAGKQAQEKAFWDRFLMYSALKSANYLFAGGGWHKDNFKPNKNLKPVSAAYMFCSFMGIYGYSSAFDLVEHLEGLGITLDLSRATTLSQCFNWACFTRIGVIDCSSATSIPSMFANAQIGIIDKLIVHENLTYSNAFQNLSRTTHMTVEGVIGKNGFNIQWMVNLDHESLMSIINALKDYSTDTSGTVWKVTIGATNRAKLTTDELLIASNKGWMVE